MTSRPINPQSINRTAASGRIPAGTSIFQIISPARMLPNWPWKIWMNDGCARGGGSADGRWCNDAWDYTRLSASQSKQINLPTQNADPKNISYHGLHTLPDSCLAANTAKPAGLSRKGQCHTGLISTSLLLSLVFWQSCQLPLFHRPKK